MFNRSLFSSEDHDTRTPKGFFEKLDQEFNFTLDVCPNHSLIDMLALSWYGRVYCNPPYNNQKPFIVKALEEIDKKHVELAVFLIPSRTDTKLFHEIIMPRATDIRFIKGRLKFEGQKNSAPFPSMIVVFKS